MWGSWFRLIPSEKIVKYPENIGILDMCVPKIKNPTIMMRSDDIKKYNLLYNDDYKVAEDCNFLITAMHNLKVANVQEVLLEYRILEGSASNKSLTNTLKYLKKNQDEILDYISSDKDIKKDIKNILCIQKTQHKILKWIFSIDSQIHNDKKYKILTLLGIKFKKISNNNKFGVSNPNFKIGKNSKILPNATVRYEVNSNNNITIGNNSMINCNFVFESNKGEIEIGDRTFIGAGTNLISRSKITIGNDVTIAFGCFIYDHNSHSLDWKERRKDLLQQIEDYDNGISFILNKNWETVKSKPITIDDKVWIGFGCTILNGVHIGEGAVIGANSTVRKDVEPWTIVAGNPAKVIKRIKRD